MNVCFTILFVVFFSSFITKNTSSGSRISEGMVTTKRSRPCEPVATCVCHGYYATHWRLLDGATLNESVSNAKRERLRVATAEVVNGHKTSTAIAPVQMANPRSQSQVHRYCRDPNLRRPNLQPPLRILHRALPIVDETQRSVSQASRQV